MICDFDTYKLRTPKMMAEELALLQTRLEERPMEVQVGPSPTQTCPTPNDNPIVAASSTPASADRRPAKASPDHASDLDLQRGEGNLYGARQVGSVFIFHATKNSTEDAVSR
jgi:hypothetical protein